ncbi:MAG TPA: hypothetical protein VM536_18175 [Chloroflexia bacterium]|nr:hypothetical protein [Chloroflexia bacterium]
MPAPVATPETVSFGVAPPDKQVIAVTTMFLVVTLFFGLRPWLQPLLGFGAGDARDLGVAGLVGGIMLWRGLNGVRGYAVRTGGDDGPLLLVRCWAPWRTIPVSLNRLQHVQVAPPVRGIFAAGLMGSALGSLFGWAGSANAPELGPVLAYATNARRLIALELSPRAEQRYRPSDGTTPRGPTLLLSPRDLEGMAAALAPFAGGRPTPAIARPAPAAALRKRRR